MAANALKATELRARTAEILQFPDRLARNRLGVRERIEALQWVAGARSRGFARIEICNGPEPDIGDFLLIYEQDRDWASWGISIEEPEFCLWKTGARGMLGRFGCLRDALRAVLEQPLRRRGRVQHSLARPPHATPGTDLRRADGGNQTECERTA